MDKTSARVTNTKPEDIPVAFVTSPLFNLSIDGDARQSQPINSGVCGKDEGNVREPVRGKKNKINGKQ